MSGVNPRWDVGRLAPVDALEENGVGLWPTDGKDQAVSAFGRRMVQKQKRPYQGRFLLE